MKAPRIPALLLVACCALGLLAAAREASAQCGDDDPTGSSVRHACTEFWKPAARSDIGYQLTIHYPLWPVVSRVMAAQTIPRLSPSTAINTRRVDARMTKSVRVGGR